MNGQAAARQGAHDRARLWLERAARLAPNDPRITLDLANSQLALGDPDQLERAAQSFRRLAERYDIVAAWLGLMTACRRRGSPRATADALFSLLSRHCVPEDEGFAAVATAVSQEAGFSGWCGMLPSGSIQVSAPARGTLVFTLDGVEIRRGKAPDGFVAPDGGSLDIRTSGGKMLLGSPLDLRALRRVEAFVSVADRSVIGWACRPACPSLTPKLTLRDAKGRDMPVTFGNMLPPDETSPFSPRSSFALSAVRLKAFTPPLRVLGPDGADVLGSPLNPAADAAITPVRAEVIGESPRGCIPARAALAVVVPVHGGREVTQACIYALLAALPAGVKIIVVDDASPAPALVSWLDEMAAAGRIALLRNAVNLGFPGAVNAGIEAALGYDVLLLNSDTLVAPGAIEALAEAAYADKDTGSATPFSNEATILSYPNPEGKNPAPDLEGAGALQRLASEVNGGLTAEIPTGVGFCMFMRHDCIASIGAFRTDLFAQGYGEENDWCLRARHGGFRHVAALGAYVAHLGGASFRAAGQALNNRNARTLNRLYPGYNKLILAHIRADPLAKARARMDAARFAARGRASGAVLLISHNHGGGVARRVDEDMQAIHASGRRPILLFPSTPEDPKNTPFPWATEVSDSKPKDGKAGNYPNLRFTLPAEKDALLDLLRGERVDAVVLHHGLGQHEAVRGLAGDLGVKQTIVLHDYASFCPRVNLLTRPSEEAPLRYCGEPNLAGCEACVAAIGDETYEGIGPTALIQRSKREFAAARRIITPSPDAARRINRHFPGMTPEVTPWEDDALAVALQPPGEGARRIAVIGGIGPHKGFDILMECARDAARRNLKLEFMVAGTSSEDTRLMETGRIFVTGAYEEAEANGFIRALRADLAFLPSIWPETWCFALSEAWRAGLYALAFDLGAQAARIKATGRGAVLPLGLPAPRINDALLSWRPEPGGG